MPAFSRAIWSTVEPSHSVWSSEMSVITETSGLDNIGRIQPAAHAHFHHRRMHLARKQNAESPWR